MKLGDVTSNSELPYYERLVSYQTATAYLNNSSSTVTADTMTMPFTGSLSCQIEWTIFWNSYQEVDLNPAISTPVPSAAGYFHTLDFSDGTCYVVHHANIYWASVAQSTVVNALLQLIVGGGGASIQTDWKTVNWRACRL